MNRILLISNSFAYGQGYLDHCAEEIKDFLGTTGDLLFIPYALHDCDRYASMVCDRFQSLGYRAESLHKVSNPEEAVARAAGLFVGGGNTFRLLKALQGLNLLEPIRDKVFQGIPYLGASAGANLACPTIKTTNDMPIVYPNGLESLNLIPFNINPHYFDTAPSLKHMGESREARLREFHEENTVPVLGLREGSFLRIEGTEAHLRGLAGARLFIRDQDPKEYTPNSRLDFLLSEECHG